MRTAAARIVTCLALIAGAVTLSSGVAADAAPTPITVTPTKIAFGNVHYGRSITKTLYVKIGAGWELDHITSPGDFPTGTPVNCGPGSQTCKIPQTFAPTSLGAQVADTTIYVCRTADGQCTFAYVHMTGTGTAPVQFLPAKVAFGNVKVGKTLDKKVTLTIDEGWYLNTAHHDAPFYSGDSTCIDQPKCTSVVSFAPLEVGAMNGALDFTMCHSGGPNTLPCIDVPLPVTGTGIAPVRFTPSKVAFYNVKVGTTKTLKVTLNIDNGWYLNSGYDDGDFSWGDSTCVGQPTCSVMVSFSPSALGPESGLLGFLMCRSGAPNNPPPNCVSVRLTATGKGI